MTKYKKHNHIYDIAVLYSNDERIYYNNKIKENHYLYCIKNNYTYYEIENKLNKNDNLMLCLELLKNHKIIMYLGDSIMINNQNIKINDIIGDKILYMDKEMNYYIINNNNINNTKNLINSIINNDNLKNNEVKILDEIYCYYNNYNPYMFLLNLKIINSKININSQIDLFNRLSLCENKKKKIIISIATIPTRIEGLPYLVDNLMNSTVKPDKILFHLPTKYKLFPNSKNHINYIKEKLSKYISDKIVYINEIKNNDKDIFDYGPCNKWLGIYDFFYIEKDIFDENFVVIVLDDDILYYNNTLEILLNKSNEYNRHVITGYHSYSKFKENNYLTVNINNNRIPLLKGVNGTLLPKHFFCNILNPSFKYIVNNGIKDISNDIVFQDDNIITTLVYNYKYNVKSIYDDLILIGRKRTYYHNKVNNDKEIDFHGVSGLTKSKVCWYDHTKTATFLKNFFKYYVY